MFRRFRLPSIKSSQLICCGWRSASTSTRFVYHWTADSLTKVLSTNVLAFCEYQKQQQSSLPPVDPEIARMSVREFLKKRSSFAWSPAIDELQSLLKPKLLSALFQSITKESSRHLLPGQVHRHTIAMPYGILARDESLKMIDGYFEALRETRSLQEALTKEDLPLAILVSIPRQGKTLFLDCVANDLDRTLRFLSDQNDGMIFVFNITFNSAWTLTSEQYSLEEASEQVALRLIGAAKGIFVNDSCQDILDILQLCAPQLSEVTAMLGSRLQEIYGEAPRMILLMDEVTELAGKVRIAGKKAPADFYSRVNSMLSPFCAVIISGFTIEGSGLTSKSGRPLYHCPLPALTNAERRRAISPMITMYFQRLHLKFIPNNHGNNNNTQIEFHPFKSALFHFELLKSSPGLFGAVLQKMAPPGVFGRYGEGSVHSMLRNIPLFASISKEFSKAVSRVLEWKSIQFFPVDEQDFLDQAANVAAPTDRVTALFYSLGEESVVAMAADCKFAGEKKHVYAGTGKISWEPSQRSRFQLRSDITTPRRAELGLKLEGIYPPYDTAQDDSHQQTKKSCVEWQDANSNDAQQFTPLSSIGVEPALLLIPLDFSGTARLWFKIFRTMLLNFSLAFYVLAFAPLPVVAGSNNKNTTNNSFATNNTGKVHQQNSDENTNNMSTSFSMTIQNNNNHNNNNTGHQIRKAPEMAQFDREFSSMGTMNNTTEFLKRMIELRFQVQEFISEINTNPATLSSSIFTCFSGKPLDVDNYLIQTRQLARPANNEVNIHLANATRPHDTTLHGYFFEDATAIGICAQKQLRVAVRPRFPQPILNCSVNRFLAGVAIDFYTSTTFFYDPETRVFAQNKDHDIFVCWIDPYLKAPKAPIQFIGHFPLHHDAASPRILQHSDSTGVVSSLPLSAAEHFTQETVLVPARPENNPLVDIIFHENLSEEVGVVQFWVDVKHRHARFSSDKKSANRFAHNVATALKNPLLQSSCVKHVVHIIVTTNAINADDARAHRTQVQQECENHEFFKPQAGESNSSSHPSYSLYFIHPDSFAFENLVSQPIARAMPSMDQQLMESWRQRLAVFPEWSKYKATTSGGLDRMIHSAQEFCEWRELRLKDDGIATLESCLLSRNHDEVYFIKNNCGVSEDTTCQLKCLCFGVFLEHLGVMRNGRNVDPRLTYSGNGVSRGIRLKEGDDGTPIHKILVGVVADRGEEKAHQVQVEHHLFKKFIRSNVRLGHLIDGHFGEYDSQSNIWNFLYDHPFMNALHQLIQEFSVPTQQYFKKKDYANAAVLGKLLWNTPLSQWRRNWSSFHKKRNEDEIDVSKSFDANLFDGCFSDEEKTSPEIILVENLNFLLWVMYVRKSHAGLTRFLDRSYEVTIAFDSKLDGQTN